MLTPPTAPLRIIPQSTNRVRDNLQKRERFAEEAANNFPCDCGGSPPYDTNTRTHTNTKKKKRVFFLRIWTPRFFCYRTICCLDLFCLTPD